MNPIVWSTSRADCAMQCLRKYNKVYNEKIKETSHALQLGTEIHSILANQIQSKNDDPVLLQVDLDKKKDIDPEIYSMVPNISKFVGNWNLRAEKDDLAPIIEQKYAITKEGEACGFFDNNAYVRGVFDMYAYDANNKRLIVIDHKSSKSASSPAKVKKNNQLNLYVYMLTKIFNFDWEYAEIALHFVRFGKLVWADLDRKEVEDFGISYMKLLSVLDSRILKAQESGEWTPEPGFYCNWCSFKKDCPGRSDSR